MSRSSSSKPYAGALNAWSSGRPAGPERPAERGRPAEQAKWRKARGLRIQATPWRLGTYVGVSVSRRTEQSFFHTAALHPL